MHFWIDKRSQTCGFSGRHRLPPAFIHTSCRQQRRQRRRSPRGGGSGGKLMVTPVHRFQPIESNGLQSGAAGVNRRGVGAGVGGGSGTGAHHFHHLPQQHQRQLHNSYLPPSYVTNLGHSRHNAAHSAELDTSVFLDLPLNGTGEHLQASASQRPTATTTRLVEPGTLRCGIGAAVAVATLFAAGLKLYAYDHKDKSGLEALGLFFLFVIVLGGACTVTMRRHVNNLNIEWPGDRDSTVDEPSVQLSSQGPSSSVGHDLVVVIEDPVVPAPAPPPSSLQHPGTPGQTELPPPPYHIAILLPHQKLSPLDNDETPPPSYDKAVG